MGLTIHYSLQPRRPLSLLLARELVETAHRRATAFVRRRGLTSLTPVRPVTTDDPSCPAHVVRVPDGTDFAHAAVRPTGGWIFSVQPGPGCEPARFGLCRYPVSIETETGRQLTGAPPWSFSTFCKTQYASLHGLEHFLHCHRAVLDLALLWRRLGCAVTINDEGDYWPKRDEAALFKHCHSLNAAIAGMAGAFKDLAEERGGPPVQSPIFAHPRFEHLEAEGVARHGAGVRRAVALARRFPGR